MDDQSLKYRLELVKFGMQDGPISNVAPIDRFRQLSRRVLPGLCWSHYYHFQASPRATVGVSGGFFYKACKEQPHAYVLELHRLPCARVRTSYPWPNPLKFPGLSYAIKSVTVDAAQNLLVNGAVYQL